MAPLVGSLVNDAHLPVRHAVAALATILVVLVISVLFDASLLDVANPTVTPNPEKAP